MHSCRSKGTEMRGGRKVRGWGTVEIARAPVGLAISSLCGLGRPTAPWALVPTFVHAGHGPESP